QTDPVSGSKSHHRDENDQSDQNGHQPLIAKERHDFLSPVYFPRLLREEVIPCFDLNKCRFSSARPVPIATQSKAFSAIWTGIPVSLLNNLSILRNNAPPPVKTIPRSIISAASSGGLFSSVIFTASTIATT